MSGGKTNYIRVSSLRWIIKRRMSKERVHHSVLNEYDDSMRQLHLPAAAVLEPRVSMPKKKMLTQHYFIFFEINPHFWGG